MITFEEFSKLELKVGTVLEAEDLEGSEKLLKLIVDIGEGKPRQIIAGIKKWYKADSLIGKQVIVVANLAPKVFMGHQSQGMMLAADGNKPILLKPSQKAPPGTKIR